MRRSLKVTGWVIGVLAAVVLVLVVTPLGFRLARGFAERAVARETGLTLSIGAVSGNMLARAEMENVELSASDGPALLVIENVAIRYDLPTLVYRKKLFAEVVVSGVSAHAERASGEIIGWDDAMRRAAGSSDTLAASPGLDFDVGFSVSDAAVTFSDTAAGLHVVVSSLAARGGTTTDAYSVAFGGSLSVDAEALSSPLRGRLAADLSGEGPSLDIASVSFLTEAFKIEVSGAVVGSNAGESSLLDLSLSSEVDLTRAVALADTSLGGAVDLSGTVLVRADVDGDADSPSYRARVSSDAVRAYGLAVTDIQAALSGGLDEIDVSSFEAALLGGLADGKATIDISRVREDVPSVAFEFKARARGLGLERMAGLAASGEGAELPELVGALDVDVALAGESSAVASLEGTFSAHADGLAVDGRDIGDLIVDGALEGGVLVVSGRCCSTDVLATGTLGEASVEDITFTIECDDLGVPGAVAGVPALEGLLSASGALDTSTGKPILGMDVDVPRASYAGVSFSPAEAHVDWASGRTLASFRTFGGAVSGTANVSEEGIYSVSVELDTLDLASIVPDSIRDEWSFEGTVSGVVSVTGDTSSVHLCEGGVSSLSLEARGHTLSLDAPFDFRACADSVSFSHVSLTTDFGWVEATGRLSSIYEGRIAARFRAIDVAALADFAEPGTVPPLEGLLDGAASVAGNLRRPSVVADVSIDGLSAAGLEFDTLTLFAEADTAELIFDLVAESADSGSVLASGGLPLTMSPDGFPVPDRGSELGVTVTCDRLLLDLGDYLLPQVRGTRKVFANGSVLLVGRPDSLATMHGRGSFDELSATFDLLRFAVSETLDFDVDGGAVVVPPTVVEVARRRVLEDEGGGRLTFEALVEHDGSLSGSMSARGIHVARMLRTFAPRTAADVRGELDVDAALTGTLTEPAVDLEWDLRNPVISGLAFEGSEGSARLTREMLTIGGASLSAGDHSIEAEGVVPLSDSHADGEPAGFDLAIRADGFDLASVRAAIPEVKSLGGVLDADLRIVGELGAPIVEGGASLRDGTFDGYDMSKPVRDASLHVTAAGGTIVLDEASAVLGDGAARAVGFVAVEPGGESTFWLRAVLDSPELGIEEMFDARVSGDVVWAGSAGRSQMSGSVVVEEAVVSYEVGLLDALQRRPVRVVVKRPDDAMANTELDLEFSVRDKIEIDNNVADLDLEGGLHLGGTFYSPSLSGGFYAEEGNFRFFQNTFELEPLSVVFIDPRRPDPHIDLTGVGTVSDREGEDYVVTVRVQGFSRDVVPELTSEPSLSEPDILALLTIGNTAGALVGGGDAATSSGDRFGSLARKAFLSSAFGMAESALERLLRLDTVALDEEALLDGDAANADVTLGKEFGGRLRVNYTTAVGRLDEQQIEVALELAKYLALESRADPEGNHAIDLRLRVPFR